MSNERPTNHGMTDGDLEQRVIEWRRTASEAAKDDPDDWEAKLAYEIHTGEQPTYYDPAWDDAMRHSYHG